MLEDTAQYLSPWTDILVSSRAPVVCIDQAVAIMIACGIAETTTYVFVHCITAHTIELVQQSILKYRPQKYVLVRIYSSV